MRIRLFASLSMALLAAACTTDPPGGTVDPTSDGGPQTTDGSTTSPDADVPRPITCRDKVKNGDETDLDCGGACAGCADGQICKLAKDCSSQVCTGGKCATPTHTDGVKNGTETDVDCGGDAKAPKCASGKRCGGATDCDSAVCVGSICQKATDSDGVQNQGETDVDCGGTNTTKKCVDTKKCTAGTDCVSLSCSNTDKICVPAAANDGIKNGTETDIDCGGPAGTTPRCGTGKTCGAATDCTNKVCSTTCLAPTGTDGVKNGDESDVDCGGTTTGAAACVAGKSCNVGGDCQSLGCNYLNKCADGRSCTGRFGGDTCGSGEVGAGGAVHESCCKKIALPSGAKLDKYKTTAGRVRTFIESLGGNVAGWYAANRGTLSAAAQAQIDPYTGYLPTNYTGIYGVNQQIGGYIYLPTRPSTSQGCWIQGQGTHTYWLPDAVQINDLGDTPHGFSKDYMDTKPLNCVTYPLLAAFCAWDGGRLETRAESDEAYGASAYPWGASPQPAGYRLVGAAWTKVGPTYGSGACPTCDDTYANWLFNYQFPVGGNAAKPQDLSYWISPPGRFPKGAGPFGHQDIAGDMMEITATAAGNDGSFGPAVRWNRSGSYEGHDIGYGGFAFAVMTKYGKAGGRCAYP